MCRKESGSWEHIARGCCRAAAARFWAKRARELGGMGGTDGAGHVRAAFGEVVWCVKCGAYAVTHAVGLAGPCRGRPTNASQLRVFKRLWNGRHPRTNALLGGEMMREVLGVCSWEEGRVGWGSGGGKGYGGARGGKRLGISEDRVGRVWRMK